MQRRSRPSLTSQLGQAKECKKGSERKTLLQFDSVDTVLGRQLILTLTLEKQSYSFRTIAVQFNPIYLLFLSLYHRTSSIS